MNNKISTRITLIFAVVLSLTFNVAADVSKPVNVTKPANVVKVKFSEASMSYITQQDLLDELGEDKLIELTDDAMSGEINESRVNKAISYAVGTFDGYARTRYSLPVPVTEKVKSTCLDLAVYHLFKSRATNATKEGVYGVKMDAHTAAMNFLKDLAAGKAALDVPAIEETLTNPASSDEVLSKSSVKTDTFSDTNLSGY